MSKMNEEKLGRWRMRFLAIGLAMSVLNRWGWQHGTFLDSTSWSAKPDTRLAVKRWWGGIALSGRAGLTFHEESGDMLRTASP
jgi:hypothetical protein